MMKKLFYTLAMLLVLAACSNDEPHVKKLVPEAVDMGLSVKWATFNVGALEVDDYGGLYGWADTTGSNKSQDGITLEFHDLENYYVCYWKSIHYGGVSPLADISGRACDVATYKWSSEWRIPTRKEMEELMTKCKWEQVTEGTTKGYRVTGPSGKSIFMPMAGERSEGTSASGRGTLLRYWTSNLANASEQRNAGNCESTVLCTAWAMQSNGNKMEMKPLLRCYGLSVRPVHK